MPPQGRHAAPSDAMTQLPGWPGIARTTACSTGTVAERQTKSEQRGGSGSAGGGNRADQHGSGDDTPEHSHHSGSGGSSNSPERADRRPEEAEHDHSRPPCGSGEPGAASPAALAAAAAAGQSGSSGAGQEHAAVAAPGVMAVAAAPSELRVPPPLKKRKLASPVQASETHGVAAAVEPVRVLSHGNKEPLEGLSPRVSGSFKVHNYYCSRSVQWAQPGRAFHVDLLSWLRNVLHPSSSPRCA